MGKFIDLTGQTFGKLTVIGFSHKDKAHNSHWTCECNCADKTVKVIDGHALRSGRILSCGCLRKESNERRIIRHKIIDGIEYKKCCQCREFRNIIEFGKDISSGDGYNFRCRTCANKHALEIYNQDKSIPAERMRSYYQDNRDEKLAKQKDYAKLHIVERAKYDVEYRQKNKEKIVSRQRAYAVKNREKVNLSRLNYYENNPNAKIASIIRKSILNSLKAKKHQKTEHMADLLGCSIAMFRLFMENQFHDGMTWKNHGSLWHIDHFIPCAAFDLSELGQRLDCFHYTNLQPMEAKENDSKNDKLPDGTRGKYYA